MSEISAPARDTAVSAVVFDIGRVLIEWSIAALYAPRIPDADRRAHFLAEVLPEAWHMQHDEGVPLAEMIAERVARFPEWRAEIEAYDPHWLETIPGPVPGSPEIVRELAATGIPLFAITNFGTDTWAKFRPTFPLLDLMGDIVVSAHERLIKPDPAIFHLAERRFGHDRRAMLFIDDNPANIASAADLGWQVHHFRDAPTLRADLVARGLLAKNEEGLIQGA